jgi:hypothetical protein
MRYLLVRKPVRNGRNRPILPRSVTGCVTGSADAMTADCTLRARAAALSPFDYSKSPTGEIGSAVAVAGRSTVGDNLNSRI